ncbi:MAG: PilZ domain-containing protein [Candidatus Omnitrophica bacterium]|nr:PilZ domain-containing protein [Candidatus Omnitrophota bacterium]MBU1923772.1 PilZ domain-containing protein [Candidatus Omnitrophota bacterium]
MDNNYCQNERRSFVRLEYSLPLGFKICNKETISKLCVGYSVNISQSGISCNIREKVNPDDMLWLSFDRATLDFCRELEKRVFIYQNGIIGSVTRVQPEEVGTYNIGLRFITREEKNLGNIHPQAYFFEKDFKSNHE